MTEDIESIVARKAKEIMEATPDQCEEAAAAELAAKLRFNKKEALNIMRSI